MSYIDLETYVKHNNVKRFLPINITTFISTMYHQLTLPGRTDTDTDTYTRAMKRQRIFQHPTVMAALPDALIQMISDYLDAKSMTMFLTLSKRLYNVTLPPNMPPLRMRYLREFHEIPDNNVSDVRYGYKTLDRVYKFKRLFLDI